MDFTNNSTGAILEGKSMKLDTVIKNNNDIEEEVAKKGVNWS